MDEKKFKQLLVGMYGDYKIPVYVDYTIDENLTQNIETFLYRQQSLIASEHWPHLSY